MDIDIILEPDVSPQQMTELGVEAERLGIRALWSSNYHMHYDAFLALAPVAAATSRIILGPLAISPWEMHPLKMANAVLTLNEMSKGRAMIGVSGGGNILGALGWKARNDGPGWPTVDTATRKGEPDRRLRAMRECIVGKVRTYRFPTFRDVRMPISYQMRGAARAQMPPPQKPPWLLRSKSARHMLPMYKANV